MKQFIRRAAALALALTLLLTVSSCGGDVRGTIDSTAPASDSGETASAGAADKLSLGETSGGTYRSDFFGISLTLPDGWSFKTEEEIAAVNGVTRDMLDEETADRLASSSCIYDMMAATSDEMQSVNVTIQRIGLTALTMNEDDLVRANLPAVAEALGQMGYTVETKEDTCSFCGKDVPCATINMTYGEANVVEKQVYVIRGFYYAAITFAGQTETQVDAMIARFAKA